MKKVKFDIDESKNIIDGFGTSLLTKINDFMNKHIEEEKFFEKNINEYVWNIWNEIGKIIYSYGCARIRRFC